MQQYQNPILYADYSDPDVIRVGEDYYMVSIFIYLTFQGVSFAAFKGSGTLGAD